MIKALVFGVQAFIQLVLAGDGASPDLSTSRTVAEQLG
jgi:hypothetical protein